MSRWLPAAAAPAATFGSAASSDTLAAASSGRGSTEVACSSANRGVMDGLWVWFQSFARWRRCDGKRLSRSLRALFEGFEFLSKRFGDDARAKNADIQRRDHHLRLQHQPAVAADVHRDQDRNRSLKGKRGTVRAMLCGCSKQDN